jgi:transposase-like protein
LKAELLQLRLSHHNVGGLPKNVDFELLEPLRLKKYRNERGVYKTSLHLFRHTFITNAVNQNVNPLILQRITYRRLNRQGSVFPNDTDLLKALYLATFEVTKKWNLPLRNWGKVYGELSIMFEGRLK